MNFKKLLKKKANVNPAPENGSGAPQAPEGLWMKCPACGKLLYKEDVRENAYVCPKCGEYFRMRTKNRIRAVADRGSFTEWMADLQGENPLQDEEYAQKIRAVQERTGLKEALTVGSCTIGGYRTVLGVCDARFMMGSMGSAVGEKLTAAFERATRERLPVVLFCCSGGARMQEGIISLMQMAKTSAAVNAHSRAGLFYLSILTDPTTGGVTASFAMQGDIILAEPHALIGFAGPRVIAQTIGQKLPEGFQRAEFLVEKGMLDGIVQRKELKETIRRLLEYHQEKQNRPGSAAMAGQEEQKAGAGVERGGQGTSAGAILESGGQGTSAEAVLESGGQATPAGAVFGSGGQAQPAGAVTGSESRRGQLLRGAGSEPSLRPWERIQLSRDSSRPTSLDYITRIFDSFIELHGDRCFSDDGAMTGGIAGFNGRAVTVIGHQKGKNTKDNILRNFGMASPEGYRKALRLMREAEKFGRPIITFVDTSGAACGIEAEERGQGRAIAENLYEMSALKVPVLSILIGEGGSGGALGIALANEVWMMENAIYSILSPEGYASILWKDKSRAEEAAARMKITAEELKALGVIDGIIPEPRPADMEQADHIAAEMKTIISHFLKKYETCTPEENASLRYARFRKF